MKQQLNLEQLRKVRKLEAPPFLLTRINAKIMARQAEQLPTSWKWAGVSAFGLMLCLNLIGLKMSQSTARSPIAIETLANGLQMSNTNQLYHE